MKVNKVHIIIFYIIIDFLFYEEFLWDKRNKEPIEIKKFMSELIREKLLDEVNPEEYQKGISYVTLDILDFYAEYATKILLDKIYFYEHFHPEILIRKGLFSNIDYKDITEFYVPIDINITINGANFTDTLDWNVLNKEILPEKFAEIIVKDENLNISFEVPITFQIRKGIHNYIFDLFHNISKNYIKYEQEKYLGEEKQVKITRHNIDNKKNIITFLFDAKLTKLLGKKRKTKTDLNDELLPNFLRNKKEKNNVIIECKGSKNIKKSNKKIDKKKVKYINASEHDKQSTTMEENEEKEVI